MTLCSACVNDLDTLPLNPSDSTSETAYGAEESAYVAGLAKIYFHFATNDTTDLKVTDGGASELNRAFWTLQEVSCDGCKNAWANDAWVNDIDNNSWSDADNDATYAVYVRTLQGISFVNEYLRQTADNKLSDRGVDDALRTKIQQFRAEARFLRAYFYWMAIDTFGDVPFTTEDSPFGAVNPTQAKRADIFTFIVGELTQLVAEGSAMPAARSNYPRADKGSVWGLLARLYLNAEVYTGIPRWEDAKKACEEVFALGYALCPDYASLFRGDNGENPEAVQEMLFATAYDNLKTQSYGGTTYLCFAAVQNDTWEKTMMGINYGWGGLRVPYPYVEKYFNPTGQDYTIGEYTIRDRRGAELFYIKGRTQDMTDLSVFTQGWTYTKFCNIPHNMTPEEYEQTALTIAYNDNDYPLIRLAEIYLIYAEACLNGAGTKSAALPYLKELAERAGVTAPSDYDEDYLIAERARELMWEGHRRTDLIRYKKFTSGSFLWPWKGGSYGGQAFADYKVLFAIPSSELAANPELYQTEGYTR